MRQSPSQRLWVAVFGPREIPRLQEEKVLELVNLLPDARERLVVLMRYWGRKSMRVIGEAVPRADGKVGVCTELARRGSWPRPYATSGTQPGVTCGKTLGVEGEWGWPPSSARRDVEELRSLLARDENRHLVVS